MGINPNPNSDSESDWLGLKSNFFDLANGKFLKLKNLNLGWQKY
ncbi:hypothetical protein [Synechocystis sp. FACHB-383]|nr:hypothetical protein [Synechocystis sp. FACHB-383]